MLIKAFMEILVKRKKWLFIVILTQIENLKRKWRLVMSKQISKTLLLSLAISMAMFSLPPEAIAKKLTVTERLTKLSKQIDIGDKANELTASQTATLKKEVIDIKAKIDKLKEKNGGKLGLKDRKKIHKELNDLSVKILRNRLENVY